VDRTVHHWDLSSARNNDGISPVYSSEPLIFIVACERRRPDGDHRLRISSATLNLVPIPIKSRAYNRANRAIRTRLHELFRRSHIIFTVGFLVTAYYHQMQTMLPIAILAILLCLQWIFRLIKMFLPMPSATAQLLPSNVICLTIPIPTARIQKYLWSKWTPGAHLRLTIPSLGLLQPHPFTIASLPSEQKIELYVQARQGFTRRLHERTAAAMIKGSSLSVKVNFEGIYTPHIPCFGKFDVLLLISSGIGVTFTMAILKDVVQKVKMIQAQDGDCRCKRIGFVWTVKHRGEISNSGTRLTEVELSWFMKGLSEILEQSYGFVAMRIYVTQETNELVELGEVSNLGVAVDIPEKIKPYLRKGRPNLPGLVEQAADEAMCLGRLGIATCGTRSVNAEVKNTTVKMYQRGIQDIYCHAEEFDY